MAGDPILNKLGVVVKFQGENQEKKAGNHLKCETISLHHSRSWLWTFGTRSTTCRPDQTAGTHSVASAKMENGTENLIVYNVLVFKSRSSPAMRGRFAALLGRILASTVPKNRTHMYVYRRPPFVPCQFWRRRGAAADPLAAVHKTICLDSH